MIALSVFGSIRYSMNDILTRVCLIDPNWCIDQLTIQYILPCTNVPCVGTIECINGTRK